jgi:hypothetical protein
VPLLFHPRHQRWTAHPCLVQPQDEHWRMCYKALLLLEYLLKHGPSVSSCLVHSYCFPLALGTLHFYICTTSAAVHLGQAQQKERSQRWLCVLCAESCSRRAG